MKIYESRFKENVSKSELLSKMKKWFRLYNSKLYNNSLPMPSFQVKTLKNKVGLYILDSRIILLSDFYDLTEEQYESIFVHEMIHLYQHITYEVVDHGKVFKRELDRVNRIVPFEVKAKESAYNVSYGQDKGKSVGVVLEKDGLGNSVITFNLEFFLNRSNYNEIKNTMKKHLSREALVLVMGISSHPKLQTYKTKRSLRRLELYEISDKDFSAVYDSIQNMEDLL